MTAIRSWRAWSCTVGLVIDGEHRADQAAEDLVAILARVDRAAGLLTVPTGACLDLG